jgi:hypothetical protein
MFANYAVDDNGMRSIVMKALDNEKVCIMIIVVVLADSSKLLPCMILKHKTMSEEPLCGGFIVRCQPEGHMTNKFVKDWLAVVWNT